LESLRVGLAGRVRDGRLLQDELVDGLSLALNTREGVVVVSGCSHAGIVNIVKKALTVVGVEKVRAVIGGFHLVEASDERVKNTIMALRRLGVKEVYTGHCTGFKAECAFAEEFKENFKKLYCGLTAEF